MKELALILALDGDTVWVQTRRQSSCNSCAARNGCGQGLISQVLPGREHCIRALVDRRLMPQLALGDIVSITVPDEVIVRASLVVYMVPLLLLIVGAFSGTLVVPGDGGAISGGLIGLLLGTACVRWHAVAVREDLRFQPRVTEKQHLAESRKPVDCGN
jgi:sigma-E factor negative regulatory protein RseC